MSDSERRAVGVSREHALVQSGACHDVRVYLTSQHKEAINLVGRVLMDREGAALVYDKFGTGKTTIMRRVYLELRDNDEYQVGLIENAVHSPTEYQLAGAILDSWQCQHDLPLAG